MRFSHRVLTDSTLESETQNLKFRQNKTIMKISSGNLRAFRQHEKLEKTSRWTWDYPICWPWGFFFLIPPWWSTLPFPNSYPWTMNIKAVFVKGKINPFKYWDKILAWLKSKERSTRLQSAVKWKGEQWVI